MSALTDTSLNSCFQYHKHSEINTYVYGFALFSLESYLSRVRLSPAVLTAQVGRNDTTSTKRRSFKTRRQRADEYSL